MFDNIGGKIKTLAQVVCWLGIIISGIYGIGMMAVDVHLVLAGIIVIVTGSLMSWLSSFALYGFGELIENSQMIRYNTDRINKLLETIAPKEEKEPVKKTKTPYVSSNSTVKKTYDGGWICKKCSTKNMGNSTYCKDCGAYK